MTETARMNPEIKAEWVSALRSGKFPQGTGHLERDGKFCCLGVLSKLAADDGVVERITEWEGKELSSVWYGPGSSAYLDTVVQNWAGVEQWDAGFVIDREGYQCSLTSLNDSGDYDFNAIADIIEEQL